MSYMCGLEGIPPGHLTGVRTVMACVLSAISWSLHLSVEYTVNIFRPAHLVLVMQR